MPTAHTYLKILAMMEELSDNELADLLDDIKGIIDVREQTANNSPSDDSSPSVNGAKRRSPQTLADDEETRPKKP